jgi:excisionase family DNA binding protein
MEREYITVEEAAELAGVKVITVRSWYRKNKITKYLVRGRLVRLDRAEVEQYNRPKAGADA